MKQLDQRPGDEGHVLLLYYEESYRRTGVAAWLRRGLELGAKILYIEPPDELSARSLSGLLQDQPDAGEAVERGQIQVVPADRTAYDPLWQASVVEDALRQGYPSVRWSAEATTAWSVMPRNRHADFERTTADLDREILIEQQRANIHDPAHFAYPTYAKAAILRRDNLKRSADELRAQLSKAKEALIEVGEALDENAQRPFDSCATL